MLPAMQAASQVYTVSHFGVTCVMPRPKLLQFMSQVNKPHRTRELQDLDLRAVMDKLTGENSVLFDIDLTPARESTLAAIDRVESPSREQFRADYLIPRKPVVISGSLTEWPATNSWNPDYLRDRWGDHPIDHRGIKGTLAQIIERAENSTQACPEPYLKNYDIRQHLPAMLADLQPRLRYAEPNWFDHWSLPSQIRVPGTAYELFIGGDGSHIPRLHFDEYAVYNFISQIYGRKDFWFYPPDAAPCLYPLESNPYLSEIEDPLNPDPEKFPRFSEVQPIRLTLNPGETVFVAPGWWHWTRMQELSISIGTNFADRNNWAQFIREFTSEGDRRVRQKWKLIHAYLKVYGIGRSLLRH